MNILVINCGSSSLKFSLFSTRNAQPAVVASGLIQDIGTPSCRISLKEGGILNHPASLSTHTQAVELALERLDNLPDKQLPALNDLHAVGHRVVHGGEHFVAPVRIDDQVIDTIRQCAPLAPLHNPINLEGILALQKRLPHVPQIAVFDTAFHQSMEPEAFLYALPYQLYQHHGIRRYGFHGTSHQYAFFQAATLLGRQAKDFNAITCHLGNGASICAVSGGQVKDTSMGFTPLEGLMMGTRSGDIDPAIVFFMARLGYSVEQIDHILNHDSGLLGVSKQSSDMRRLLASAEDDLLCRTAVQMYVHRIIKYIGAYASVLNGTDAIVFTAGIGENAPEIRLDIMERLAWMNVVPDSAKNAAVSDTAAVISHPDSAVAVLVIPADEAHEIAVQTMETINT